MRLRSLLFTPAHMPERFGKALASEADVIIFDLEDAVAPAIKAEARDNLRLLHPREAGRKIAVRVNPADTDWHAFDLEAVVAAKVDLVMLPKCGGAVDVAQLDRALAAIETVSGRARGSTGIIALAGEDAESLANLDYRQASSRLVAIALGAEDLSGDLGVDPRDGSGQVTPLIAHARMLIAFAARRVGIAAIDTPFPNIADPDAHAREAQEAVAMGFAGKMCIHPGQIAALNAAFQPSEMAIDRARRIVAAFERDSDLGVMQMDGKMIDKAHLQGARRLLERL